MVKINGIDWKIFLVSSNHPFLMLPDGTFTFGCCDNDLKGIYIAEDLSQFYLKKVLCHELVHACMFSYKVGLNEQQEEVFADLIATYGEEIVSIANFLFNIIKKGKLD